MLTKFADVRLAALALAIAALACNSPIAGEPDALETRCGCDPDELCVIHIATGGTVHSVDCQLTELDCEGVCSSECESAHCNEYAFCDTVDLFADAFTCLYP